MKYWKISENGPYNRYLIPTEKSIWLTYQKEDANINELLATEKLGKVKSIRYENLKEIIFIDNDFAIEFQFKDDNTPEERYIVDHRAYHEIKSYLRSNLKGIEIKDYSVLKQLLPQIITLGISIGLIVATYIMALELERGESVKVAGRKAWLKDIIISIAEVLGSIGTLVVGSLILGLVIYALLKKYRNPKRGEILKINRSPRLAV